MCESPDADHEKRGRRHEFLLQYYQMAVADLDRHLKGGWQTVLALGGATAVLVAGHEGNIGSPIASLIALAIATWAALTVLDANYWSIRAIGFLANVEAVYFAEPDRKNFHPYLGQHPPYKLMDSLRYLYWLSIVFGILVLANHVWEFAQNQPSFAETTRNSIQNIIFKAYWLAPILAPFWVAFLLVRKNAGRLNDYNEFVTASPGPGVPTKMSMAGDVLLGNERVTENDTHKNALDSIEKWTLYNKLLFWLTLVPALSGSIFYLIIILGGAFQSLFAS